MSRRKEPAIPNELLDQLLAGGGAGAALAQGGLLDALKKALAERVSNAGMDHRRCRQQPQRLRLQDDHDRYRQAGDRCAARLAGEFRSAVDRQIPAALPPASAQRRSALPYTVMMHML